MRTDFDQEKKRAVNVATRSLERDLERLKADHATEIEELVENHKQELSENKKKQWVSSCYYFFFCLTVYFHFYVRYPKHPRWCDLFWD